MKSEKVKYYMIPLIYETKINELIYKTNRLKDIENKLMVTKGERGGW